jgi:TatD DNase family protein
MVLIETDAPYLAPHPHRGKLNHSGLLSYTASALAEVWGITAEEVSEITYQNAKRFFNL